MPSLRHADMILLASFRNAFVQSCKPMNTILACYMAFWKLSFQFFLGGARPLHTARGAAPMTPHWGTPRTPGCEPLSRNLRTRQISILSFSSFAFFLHIYAPVLLFFTLQVQKKYYLWTWLAEFFGFCL